MRSNERRRGGALSRVTLVGDRRRVDLVLPSHDPVGELLPEVLRLLDDRPASQPQRRRLVTVDGTVLAQDDTLASAGIPDGTVLRLVREPETPPAPVVHDVTDEVADHLDARDWRWDERARTGTAGVGAIVLALVAAWQGQEWTSAETVGVWALAVAGAAAVLGVTASLVGGGRPLGALLFLPAGALGGFGAWAVTEPGPERLAATGAATVVTLVLLGVFTPAGRGALVGAAAVMLLLGGWELAWAVNGDHRDGVVLGVVSVLALGLLPRFALMTAGLTALDDRQSGGAPVSRRRVDAALVAAHRGLALATVATAASAAVAGWLAVREATGWTVTVTALLAVVLLSRARAFPLGIEVVALLAAGVVLMVRLVLLWAEQPGQEAVGPLAALAALALAPLVFFMVRPPDHVRVRLRRLTNLVESLGVVALIPVAVGAFGVYGRLLNTF